MRESGLFQDCDLIPEIRTWDLGFKIKYPKCGNQISKILETILDITSEEDSLGEKAIKGQLGQSLHSTFVIG